MPTTRTCGFFYVMNRIPKNKINISEILGSKFGRLTPIKEVENYITPKGNKKRQFLCKCDCNNEKIVYFTHLKSGTTKSCGCYQKEQTSKSNGLHLETNRTTEYETWCGIKKRCYNKKCKAFMNYGGRGIKVCDRWLNSYENFLEDMGRKPTPLHSIDRIDNDGNYEPNNCKWATAKEQTKNRRNTLFVDYNGISKTIKEWSSYFNISYQLLHQRLKRDEIPFEQAIKLPFRRLPHIG